MAHRAITSSASVVLCLLAFVFHLEPTVADAADVLTQHNDNARTGANPAETMLNAPSLRSGTFGKLWTLYADGQVVAQPLYVSGLAINTTAQPRRAARAGNVQYRHHRDDAQHGLCLRRRQ